MSSNDEEFSDRQVHSRALPRQERPRTAATNGCPDLSVLFESNWYPCTDAVTRTRVCRSFEKCSGFEIDMNVRSKGVRESRVRAPEITTFVLRERGLTQVQVPQDYSFQKQYPIHVPP